MFIGGEKMKENKTFLIMLFFLFVLFFVIPINSMGKGVNRCSCYFTKEVKNACYEGEYRGEKLISGECRGGCCYTHIKVKCYDKKEKDSYTREVYQERCDCNECVGGGDDPFWNFWWIPLL
jgi:hypothetical protein